MSNMSALTNATARLIGNVLSPAGKRARLVVFCYHQVLAEPDAMRPSEPDRQAFAADLDRIKTMFNVIDLPDAARQMKSNSLPARAACITFDDGYANNHDVAAPLLTERDLPATFFITCGALEQGVMWNDLIIEGVAGAKGELDLSALAKLTMPVGLTAREQAKTIIAAIKYLPLGERWNMAEAFYRANVSEQLPRLMMSKTDVAALAKQGFDIGAHTMSHPILKELSDDEAEREIVQSLDWLEQATGKRPITFAYPNGNPGVDFAPVHERQVSDAGCAVAVSTQWAVGKSTTDAFSVPRIGPWWRQGTSTLVGLLKTYVKSYL